MALFRIDHTPETVKVNLPLNIILYDSIATIALGCRKNDGTPAGILANGSTPFGTFMPTRRS